MVLIVDDNAEMRDMLASALSLRKVPVLVSATRENALQMLEGTPDICCILLDFNMPGMGAEEFIRNARRIAGDIPIVLMTGSDAVETRAKALGLTQYFSKPIVDFEHFYKIVDDCHAVRAGE